jgi:hypothetical protein
MKEMCCAGTSCERVALTATLPNTHCLTGNVGDTHVREKKKIKPPELYHAPIRLATSFTENSRRAAGRACRSEWSGNFFFDFPHN